MDRMPVLFVGHGSPMNAIENNAFTKKWMEIGASLPRPEVILAVSAHWTTEGTRITDSSHPRTVYDMYGFPKELYEVAYQPPGSPVHAAMAAELLGGVMVDNTWGLDHGAWSVLARMYPNADIPVFQLSLDLRASRQDHFEMGRKLRPLRDRNVMILGSGNVVHNLARVNWDMEDGYSWAIAFDGHIRSQIEERNFASVLAYEEAGDSARLAFRTLEHFDPLLYVLGASTKEDHLSVFNDKCTMGSISMTGYIFA
jgi:4,5-DOPA dioxygenase extradiol